MSKQLQLPLRAVLHVFRQALPVLERWEPDPLLARARLCDMLRDRGTPVPSPLELDQLTGSMDAEAWRRLMLFTNVAEDPSIGEAVSVAAAYDERPSEVWKGSFVGFAASMDLHPIPLLRESNHRLEEIARSWLLRLGIGIAGETVEQSVERLTRLDYARLLAEADRARAAADERLAYLRKLQEKADRLRAPRGKW